MPAVMTPSRSVQNVFLVAMLVNIFSEAALINIGFDLKASYLIMLVCYPVMLWFWDGTSPSEYKAFLAYLATVGLLPSLSFGGNVTAFLPQFFGIFLSSLFAYLFFRQQDRQPEEIFHLYAESAFWICLLGILLSMVNTAVRGQFIHVRSILLEPEHFCEIVLPGYFYFLQSSERTRARRLRLLIMTAAIVLSLSSTGIIGLLCCLLLRARKQMLRLGVAAVTVVAVSVGAFFAISDVRLRAEDSVRALASANVSGVNLSTYALLSNLYVTTQILSEHPVVGAGLGQFVYQHRRFISDLPGVQEFEDIAYQDLNEADANSLALRMMGDLGLLSMSLLLLTIVLYRPARYGVTNTVGYACSIYIFMKLLREGHYFSPEMYFFVWTYAFCSRRVKEPKAFHAMQHIHNALSYMPKAESTRLEAK